MCYSPSGARGCPFSKALLDSKEVATVPPRAGPWVRKECEKHTAVARALARVSSDAAEPTTNVVPALLDAVSVYATVGELTNAFEMVVAP